MSKQDKMLAEWFWTDRWMGSSAFLLPQEARGLYREMLTQAWRRGAQLPNDHEAIMRATGTTAEEWARSWPKVERYWRVDGDSLVNDTQLEVYMLCIGLRDKRIAAGSKGGSNAQAKRKAKGRAKGQAGGQAKTNPPDPSPYSVLRTPEERTNDARERATPANPLIAGRRPQLETECLQLVTAIATAEHVEPEEVMREAAHYDGAARSKLNPASMSDDRLLNTVLDLRARNADIQRAAARSRPRPVEAS